MTVPAFQTNCAHSFAFDGLKHRRVLDHSLHLRNPHTHAAVTCITGHTSPITGVLFSPTLIVAACFCATMCTINHQLSAVFSRRGLSVLCRVKNVAFACNAGGSSSQQQFARTQLKSQPLPAHGGRQRESLLHLPRPRVDCSLQRNIGNSFMQCL